MKTNSKYKTHIVLFNVEITQRRMAENIEGMSFNCFGDIVDAIKSENFTIWPITDFMDACNNQEIDLENFWISYVNLKSN